MGLRALATSLLVPALLGACSGDVVPRGPLYEVTATVIEEEGEGPQICLGLVALSDPPQCGGPSLEGWDWGDVEGEERGEHVQERGTDVTFGHFHVVGSYDGEAFTVVHAGPPKSSKSPPDDIGTPCAEPPGGWKPVDPKKDSEWASDRAGNIAEEEPDFAGVWVDYYDSNPEDEAGKGIWGDSWADDRVILNIAFTGSLKRHERELRKVWGGPLCLVKQEHTEAELRAIQDELTKRLEGNVLSSWIGVDGTIVLEVIVADAATDAAVEGYEPGLVEIEERLRPVE